MWTGSVEWKVICVIIFLGINTWLDLAKKEISIATVIVFGLVGLIENILKGTLSWQNCISVGISIFFLVLSVFTRGDIGLGDGLLLLALGCLLSTEEFIITLAFAMLLCSVWAGIMLLILQKGKNAEIPFVPFLLLGFVGGLFL